jgi:hypothetical protein
MGDSDYNISPEKIAYIAYDIGVYETVQKFGDSIIKGKITSNMNISKITEVLATSYSFYDSDLISQIVNVMISQSKESSSIIVHVTAEEVNPIMRQLKASGISLPI